MADETLKDAALREAEALVDEVRPELVSLAGALAERGIRRILGRVALGKAPGHDEKVMKKAETKTVRSEAKASKIEVP